MSYRLKLDRTRSEGRAEYRPADKFAQQRVHFTRVPLNTRGCDPGGAYWGLSRDGDLYCAEYIGVDRIAAYGTRLFVFAHTRASAKHQISERYPSFTFYR